MRTKLYKIIVLILISSLLNKITVSCKEKNTNLKIIRGKQIEIKEELAADKDVSRAIQPYHDELQNKINEVLCYSPRVLSRTEAALESSLGNFYADACYTAADSIFFGATGQHINFALFNYGGIRTSIPKGAVTVDNVFRLMPFENKLVVVNMTGEKVKELFEFLERRQVAHPLSGVQLILENDKFSQINILGAAFDLDKKYWVLTHDYLQHGGDNMAFFKDPIDLFPTNIKVRDALIENLRNRDTLKATLDNRFIKIN